MQIAYANKGRFTEDFLYSNQWLPLQNRTTLNEKINLGADLDKRCGGGQISHINIQSRFPNFNSVWNLTNKIAKSGLIYFAYNMKINTCEDGHAFIGTYCPKCGKTVANTFSRVVGYLTPKSSYSAPRKREFDKRQWFNVA